MGSICNWKYLELFATTYSFLYPLYFPIAGLMVTFAQDVYLIYAGRAITGFCIGIISLSLPVYLAEAIHPEVRGTLGLLPTSLGEVICISYRDFFMNSVVIYFSNRNSCPSTLFQAKANFKVFIWTKKRTKTFLYFCPSFKKN